jgi:nucleoside-diphosphate-sugar epimerase
VVHTAGFVSDWAPYEDFREVNVQGTKYLLVAAHAQGVKHFIHTSSLGVFGDTDQDQIDENNRYVLSSDAYSNSKIYAEIFVRRYCQENGVAFTIFRPGFIYGEGDNNFFPRLIENLESGKAKYIGSTENIVNTVYVGNIEELVATIIGNPAAVGETYNISDPQSTTIRELYDTVCEALDLPKPTAVIPKPISLGAAAVIETLAKTLGLHDAPPLTRKKVTFVARSRSVNAKKAYSLIGREPFGFQEGIRRTLEHIRNAK